MNSTLNQEATTNPQPGDYWHEMFCPCFLVVRVKGNDITILDFMSKDPAVNARIVDTNGWDVDYTRARVVDRAWIKNMVSYNSIPGFVADVVRSKRWSEIAEQWRIQECARLRKAWEELTGWSALHEN